MLSRRGAYFRVEIEVTNQSKSEDRRRLLRGQLDEVLIPYPTNLTRCVVLVFCQPKLAFLADHVKYLENNQLQG